jgi:hypothetical protein
MSDLFDRPTSWYGAPADLTGTPFLISAQLSLDWIALPVKAGRGSSETSLSNKRTATTLPRMTMIWLATRPSLVQREKYWGDL